MRYTIALDETNRWTIYRQDGSVCFRFVEEVGFGEADECLQNLNNGTVVE